ncbi:bis(5'-nucleosyl)-tetraphosphatase (symmetrical) YqeK [Fonticella tunisiensis]|uniref:bis(5'-nucleosyl)-tetraphosphatase (symmetrical) n=1 Tax=Fonticella tunisiensis TaxID=1096341 RepID=A0A4R7KR54_9CLOT|nr:bis(5'-nucleosyl)-tetraphosphatase (symmetrical) YqeK [Fonticella tunisiensis]TDT61216.1 putative HD superfamily hydrolase involved in NAD metabolism [Fonticella tunisiensis]
MKPYEYIKEKVRERLGEKRFNHSLRVEKEAVKLGKIYGENIEKCKIAAITHDIAKQLTDDELLKESKRYGISVDDIQLKSPQLLHGYVGAEYCREEFDIKDRDILNAIAFHTTGRKNMTLLEKIIFLADLIEEERSFPGVSDIRRAAISNLDEALILSCNSTLIYVINRNLLVHPLTIEFRNSLLLKG